MIRARRALLSFGLALLIALPALRPAMAASDAGNWLNDVGGRVLHLISDKQTPEAQRKQQFAQLVEQSFDVPGIARFVLGRYWRTASDQEKQQFSKVFETYMINVYWSRFTAYSGESFKVVGQPSQNGDNLVVTTQVLRPNGQPPVKVDWTLNKQGDAYKIRDASLEGVSQALTYRDEFSSIIERNGGQVSALISELNGRAANANG